MSPTQQLRAAAALLRERAEAATPGPREVECIGSEGWHVFGPRGLDERFPQRRPRVAAVTWGSFESDKADAAYIATTAPPFALAVAAWLDTCAYLAEHGDDGGPRLRDHALDVARIVLGGGADE